jgi:hypothetical protein
MGLDTYVNKALNINVSNRLDVGNGQIGIYANRRRIDEKENRIIIYYYDELYGLDSKNLEKPKDYSDFIKVKGRIFEIEYCKEQRPKIATAQEQKEMYDKVRKKKE